MDVADLSTIKMLAKEIENQNPELNDYSVGIGLGVKELAVISYDGNSQVYSNINKSKKVRDLKKKTKISTMFYF